VVEQTSAVISSAPADTGFCMPCVDAFPILGAEVWFDREAKEDNHFRSEEAQERLQESSRLLIRLTPRAYDSIRVGFETMTFLNLALDDESRSELVVLLEHCPIPKMLKAWPLLDVIGQPANEAAVAIRTAVDAPRQVSKSNWLSSMLDCEHPSREGRN
jgi:hypothetical protein